MMLRLATATALAVAILAAPAQAADTKHVNVGVLKCKEGSDIGYIIGSTTKLKCEFTPVGGGKVEHYTGKIEKFGIDIGETKASELVWGVLAPSAGKLAPNALAGEYGGLTAEATLTVGLGANVLLGGSAHAIALQPVSTQTQQGFDIAAGVAGLVLKPAQ